MSSPSNGQAPCPTCPGGQCPPIDSTPTCPRPSERRISEAALRIPDVLVERFAVSGRYEAIVLDLVAALGEPEFGRHQKAAEKWAVHTLLQKGMLSPHLAFSIATIVAENSRPTRIWDREANFFRARPQEKPKTTIVYEPSKPGEFDTILVRAEETLWTWWSQGRHPDELFPSQILEATPDSLMSSRVYTSGELCRKLDVTSKTLNKYASAAMVSIPKRGRGGAVHRFTTQDLLAICRQILKGGGENKLRKLADSILAQHEVKLKENQI